MRKMCARAAPTLVTARRLPPMRITEKRKLKGDGDEVVLVPLNARFAGDKTVLRFPAMKDSPARSFNFGEVVTLVPAGDANGWWVRADGGKNLAYVPTSSTAQLTNSKAL